VVEEPGMCGSSLHRNREIPRPASRKEAIWSASGRRGAIASPLLSNILLTPLDREMRSRGYQLTRYADDWVITCASATEARAALMAASRVLEKLGVNINPQKTRIVHVLLRVPWVQDQARR
jgi:hypothetical protein